MMYQAISLTLHNHPVRTKLLFTLQLRKLRVREPESLAEGHTASWRGRKQYVVVVENTASESNSPEFCYRRPLIA